MVVGLALMLTAACSSYQPSYDMNDNVDPGLVGAIHFFAQALADNDQETAIYGFGASFQMKQMEMFVRGYEGHPATVVNIREAGDQVVVSVLDIECAPRYIQRVRLVWAWRNGGWRGWPASGNSHPCN